MAININDWVRITTDDYHPVSKGSEGRVTDVDVPSGTLGVMIKRDPQCNNYDFLLAVVDIRHVSLDTRCPRV